MKHDDALFSFKKEERKRKKKPLSKNEKFVLLRYVDCASCVDSIRLELKNAIREKGRKYVEFFFECTCTYIHTYIYIYIYTYLGTYIFH